MKIASIRLGHANNSSSTHSILLRSKAPHLETEDPESLKFGWDWFHLTAVSRKAEYMAVLLYESLRHELPEPFARIVAHELTGIALPSNAPDDFDAEPFYVDHQSVPCFPREFGKATADAAFIAAFTRYVINRKDVSILGGNDNEANTKYGGKTKLNHGMPLDTDESFLVAREDREWWILYNRKTGAKVRLSFQDSPEPYTEASTPELVDLKITQYCPRACGFCYMESGPRGAHADIHAINSIAYRLAKAKVFEVAIGGGEPTTHPDFAAILKTLRDRCVTPNFTSFDMAWTENEQVREAVRKYAGSFAISGMSPEIVDQVAAWNKALDFGCGPCGTIQVPLGCYTEAEIANVLRAAKECYVPVTLLGFKQVGRGASFASADYSWILDLLERLDLWRFGGDSLFVEQFGAELQRRGISEKLIVSREGAFSMYIDAVEMRAGPSSYHQDRLHDVKPETCLGKFPYTV